MKPTHLGLVFGALLVAACGAGGSGSNPYDPPYDEADNSYGNPSNTYGQPSNSYGHPTNSYSTGGASNGTGGVGGGTGGTGDTGGTGGDGASGGDGGTGGSSALTCDSFCPLAPSCVTDCLTNCNLFFSQCSSVAEPFAACALQNGEASCGETGLDSGVCSSQWSAVLACVGG